MSSEPKPIPIPTPEASTATERRRRGRPAESKEKNSGMVLFYLGEASSGKPITLKEEYASEGEAMIESLKKGVPYFRIEVWKARAVVKDGGVEVMKDQISVRA